jgi:hypothetical protein
VFAWVAGGVTMILENPDFLKLCDLPTYFFFGKVPSFLEKTITYTLTDLLD